MANVKADIENFYMLTCSVWMDMDMHIPTVYHVSEVYAMAPNFVTEREM